MKWLTRKRLIIISTAVIVLAIGCIALRPQINRWLDNRDRAVMGHHALQLEDKIQRLGRQNNAYPSSDQVKRLIEDSGYVSPHTKRPYTYIGQVTDVAQVKDSQIGYGFGDMTSNPPSDKTVYVCIGIGMPRTHEDGASCDQLYLNKQTDTKIKYYLSCKTDWLGFSTGCDKSILQAYYSSSQ